MSESKNWLVVTQRVTNPTALLICIPHAGAGISAFHSWRAKVSPELQLALVRLPGRESRISEPPISDLSAMVTEVAAAITPYLTLPYALFGHCSGALLAYELTRELRRHKTPLPNRLFVSSYRAPHLVAQQSRISDLPDDQFAEELRRLGGTPEAILAHPEMMSIILPAARADFTAVENYEYYLEPKLQCSIHTFVGANDSRVSIEEAEAWSSHTSSSHFMNIIESGHFFLQSAADVILEQVSAAFADGS